MAKLLPPEMSLYVPFGLMRKLQCEMLKPSVRTLPGQFIKIEIELLMFPNRT